MKRATRESEQCPAFRYAQELFPDDARNLTQEDLRRDRHWSDIVPPMSALTFAVIWDPDDGMVAFSDAQLLDNLDIPDSKYHISPSDVYETDTQTVTFSPSPIPPSENTATLAVFRDAYLRTNASSMVDRYRKSQTMTSSTMGGVDVYTRGSLLPQVHLCKHYSCLDALDAGFEFNVRTAFDRFQVQNGSGSWSRSPPVHDEGICVGHHCRVYERTIGDLVLVEVNLSSAFSTTTTSTSSYIEVKSSDIPWWRRKSSLIRTSSGVSAAPTHRRLKKRRPFDAPAHPSDVLAREQYNHIMPTTTSTTKPVECMGLVNFIRGIGKCPKEEAEDDRWLYLETTQEDSTFRG